MTVEVVGTVTSGLGRGAAFVALEGYARQFQAVLGYEPYPGTLNLDLSRPATGGFDALDPVRIERWEDGERSFGAVDCYPAAVRGNGESVALHVIVPDRTDHDSSTCELISPINLREHFGLSDGAALEVRVGSADADGE